MVYRNKNEEYMEKFIAFSSRVFNLSSLVKCYVDGNGHLYLKIKGEEDEFLIGYDKERILFKHFLWFIENSQPLFDFEKAQSNIELELKALELLRCHKNS